MEADSTGFVPKEKTRTTLSDLIESACAPIFQDFQKLVGVEITSEQIIQFAEEHEVKDDSVQLATHICEVLLQGILDAKSDVIPIDTAKDVREKTERIMDRNEVHLKSIISTYTKYDLPLSLRRDLLILARKFLKQL